MNYGKNNKTNNTQLFERKANGNHPVKESIVQPPKPTLRHPEDHLKITNGVVSAIHCSYRFSEPALKALKHQFAPLFVDGSGSRFYVGDKQGFKNHPHPVGAFQRSHYDNLIRYREMQPEDWILEPGASNVRNYTRYIEVDGRREPWGKRIWAMNPHMGLQDELRLNNHKAKLEEASKKFKAVQAQLHPHDPWEFEVDANGRLKDGQCTHKLGETPKPATEGEPACNCTKAANFTAIKAIEVWYYDGVRTGIHEMLTKMRAEGPGKFAYVVGNDYWRMLQQEKKKKDSPCFKAIENLILRLAATDDTSSFSYEGKAIVDIEGEPESTHTVTLSNTSEKVTHNRDFLVTARVKGNPLPYQHKIPLTGERDAFGVEYTAGDGKQWIMLYEVLEKFQNGDVPFVLYKITPIERSVCTDQDLRNLELVRDGFAKLTDLVSDEVLQAATKWGQDRESELKSLTSTKPNVWINAETLTPCQAGAKSGKKVEEIVPLKDFNLDLYTEKMKLTKGTQNLKTAEWHAQLETNSEFIRFIKDQVAGRYSDIRMLIKVIDGETHLEATRYQRTFFGLVVSATKDYTAIAKTSDILKAYNAIGVKSNITSIHSTMIKEQRDIDDPTEMLFGMTDAYIIARLLRKSEADRLDRLTSSSKQ